MRIALADDQALVLHGLRALIETLGGIEVSIEAQDGDELLTALRRQPVDVVVCDIRMPRRWGWRSCVPCGTWGSHLSDILRKLEARDRTHAVLKAIGARML